MSFERRNLALPAIITIAAVIVINAVVGQDGKHPAPLGSSSQHQKITKSKTPIIKSRFLKRKSRPPKKVTITPRSKPKVPVIKDKRDGISRLLEAASGNRKNNPATKTSLLDDKKIRFVQTRLAQLGYEPGPVDGVFGQKTREAIKKFENSRQIPVTGEISKALIEALSRRASFASLELT